MGIHSRTNKMMSAAELLPLTVAEMETEIVRYQRGVEPHRYRRQRLRFSPKKGTQKAYCRWSQKGVS